MSIETNKPAAAPVAADKSPPAAPPPKGNSLRLVILLGVLVLVVGAYAYDFFILKPSCNAAYAKIQALVDERNKQGVKEADLVTSADVQKAIGRQPTYTDDKPKDGYTIEYYCWWGKVPLLTRRRHFIAVVYTGNEPRHFSSHYQEEPPKEALPLAEPPPKDTGETAPMPQAFSEGSSGGPAPPPEIKPADSDKPADADKPAESDKPAAKSADSDKPADSDKSADSDKPAEKAKTDGSASP